VGGGVRLVYRSITSAIQLAGVVPKYRPRARPGWPTDFLYFIDAPGCLGFDSSGSESSCLG